MDKIAKEFQNNHKKGTVKCDQLQLQIFRDKQEW